MSISIEFNSRQILSVMQSLEAMQLPRKKRFWLLKDLGRFEIQKTKQRLMQQKDANDQSFVPGKKKTRVLLGFRNGLESYVTNGAKDLIVTWKSNITAKKANVHQQGKTQTISKKEYIEEQNKRFGVPRYQDPATEKQASRLRSYGFRNIVAGKSVRMSKADIIKNFKLGQAGLIIRLMEKNGDMGNNKENWKIVTPQREFLGTSGTELKVRLLKNIQKAKYGR